MPKPPARAPKPRKSRKPRSACVYTAEELKYIDAWFDMVVAWQNGNLNAWDEVFGRLDTPAPR
jgi:hypothetical protein